MAIDIQTSKAMTTANFSKLSFRPNAAERVFLEQFAQRNGTTTSVTQTLHMLIAECMDRGVGGWGDGNSSGYYSYPPANDRQIRVVMAGDNSSYFGHQISLSSSFTPDSINNNNFKHEYDNPQQLPFTKPSLRRQQQQQLPQSVQPHAGTDTLDEQVSSMLFYVYNVLPRTNPSLASYIINGMQQTELKTQQIDMLGQMFQQQQQQQYQQSNQNMANVSNSTAYPYSYQQQQYYAPAAQQYPAASLTPSSSAMMTPSLPQSTPTVDNIAQTKPPDFLDMAIETTEKTARLNKAMRAMYGWP